MALLFLTLLELFAAAPPLAAQGGVQVTPAHLSEVMPSASRFSEKAGEPPVYQAYGVNPSSGQESLIGYVFLTSDVPPEVVGYLSPIHVLVGLDLNGGLTGLKVVWHREPLVKSRRDFLEDPVFLRQFTGKHLADPFRLRTDLRGISGATVSVAALALGVRNASRRVASAYQIGQEQVTQNVVDPDDALSERLARLSWFEILSRGLVKRIAGEVDGMSRLDIYIADLWDEGTGEVLLGQDLLARALRQAGDRAQGRHLMFLGIEGQNLAWFRPNLFFVVQGGDTIRVSADDIFLFNDPKAGKVVDQLGSAGIWLLDPHVDISRSFHVGFGGDLGLTLTSLEYPGRPMQATAVAERDMLAAPVAEQEVTPTVDSVALHHDEVQRATGATVLEGGRLASPPMTEIPRSASDLAAAASPEDVSVPPLDLYHVEEESQLARTLARTSWTRVAGLLLLLVVATVAFYRKSTPLRWLTLAGTVFFLGFWDRGFLSISHLSSAIVVGPGLFLSDLSLLILVLFTVTTTLLWGRVFCGYLCPFGVLQDFLERIVPRRLQRRMPQWIHQRALLIKYVLLAVVLLPAVVEVIAPTLISDTFSIYHFFEPFGTVFFLSPSLFLWTIAITFLVASAIVPRFYCRYLCPLGAALAVASRISPFRIRRVEQCTLCKVCEHSCPTGAIQGSVIDFPECVRCSICEVKLIERAGTCRHEMDTIRPRLIQITPASR